LNNTTSEIIDQRYEPSDIEAYWQKEWANQGLYRTNTDVNKDNTFYALSMFPYPSGSLHMGHVRNYVITDVLARYKRMQGYNVLHPMGWDAFGLPAENAAIERETSPSTWTDKNISQMKDQLDRLGLSIDWSKEVTTCEKDYYKWTQYIFNQLHKNNLAYQKKATVNWDPIDQTVLANEQVDAEGKSWRSGAKVEKKELNQWFLSITSFAEDLNKDLVNLKDWPERVRVMQKNWIGKSIGAEITFDIKNHNQKITAFTTRIDTIYGVSYLVLASNHPLIDQLISNKDIDQLIKFKENEDNLFSFEIATKLIRNYPYKSLAAHVIGYTQPITDSEYKFLSKKGYKFNDLIGRTGIEYVYEDLIRGEWGGEMVEVNSFGKFQRSLGVKNSRQGNDIELTIDIFLQH